MGRNLPQPIRNKRTSLYTRKVVVLGGAVIVLLGLYIPGRSLYNAYARHQRERQVLSQVRPATANFDFAGSEWLSSLFANHFRFLKSVSGVGITGDDDVAYLAEFEDLRAVRLHGTGITDLALARLRTLQGVEHMVIRDTNVTDEGLRHLSELKNLRTLQISGGGFSDSALPYLATLSGLTYLEMRDTGISDAGLPHLITLEKLEAFDFGGSKVTEEGLAELKRQFDLPHSPPEERRNP